MKKKFSFFKLLTGLVLLGSIITLSGCMAAIPLVTAAQAALFAKSVTKEVQRSTDGKIEMIIGENEIPAQNKLVLAKISKLAIWPEEGMVVVASELQKLETFDSIATPSKVIRVLDELGFNQRLDSFTHEEKLEAFRKACEQTDSEAIVAFEDLGSKINMRLWSFRRNSNNLKGKILIFELQSNQIIFSSITEVVIGLGGSNPSQNEIMAEIGRILAQKITELKSAQTIAQK